MSDATDAVAGARTGRFDWPGETLAAFRSQWILFVLPALFLAGNELMFLKLAAVQRTPLDKLLLSTLTITLPAALFALFIVRLVQLAVFVKPVSPARVILSDVTSFLRSPRRIVNGLPPLIAVFLFNKAMLDMKPAIPAINPFSWDASFAALDRAIHFGIDPWRLLQPVMGFDAVTFAVNLGYNFWFLALFALLFRFGFENGFSRLRTQFFLGYMIAWWIGGGLLAVFFSSAGPCYFSLVVPGADPFAPLMSYLRDVDGRLELWALDAQRLLWDGYTGQGRLALGISAFPSMHNAMATVFALTGFRIHRLLGWIFTANVVLILLGSVHLGWHYAVDGYAGIAVAAASWWLAGAIADWYHGRDSVRDREARFAAG